MIGGTTSACAENTRSLPNSPRINRNYLRVRGEYTKTSDAFSLSSGTTSACAENTVDITHFDTKKGNYLRVRGEYLDIECANGFKSELPPRARRIP